VAQIYKLISIFQESLENLTWSISNYLRTYHEATKIGSALPLENKQVACQSLKYDLYVVTNLRIEIIIAHLSLYLRGVWNYR
jgi:hypothetical protein